MKCIFISHKQLKEKSSDNNSFRGFFVPITEELSKYLVEDLERISQLSELKY